jgi:hypothetical protein
MEGEGDPTGRPSCDLICRDALYYWNLVLLICELRAHINGHLRT